MLIYSVARRQREFRQLLSLSHGDRTPRLFVRRFLLQNNRCRQDKTHRRQKSNLLAVLSNAPPTSALMCNFDGCSPSERNTELRKALFKESLDWLAFFTIRIPLGLLFRWRIETDECADNLTLIIEKL